MYLTQSLPGRLSDITKLSRFTHAQLQPIAIGLQVFPSSWLQPLCKSVATTINTNLQFQFNEFAIRCNIFASRGNEFAVVLQSPCI